MKKTNNRGILKLLYGVIVVIFGIVVGLAAYSMARSTHLTDLVNEIITNENYDEIARLSGGFEDSTNLISYDNSNDSNKVDMVLQAGLDELTYEYKTDVDGTRYNNYYHQYEYSYRLFLFKINYDYSNIQIDSSSYYNGASVRLFSENGSYDFHLEVGSKTNAYNQNKISGDDLVINGITINDYYKDENTLDTAIIHQEKNYISFYEQNSFANISLNQSSIKYIENKIGKITSFNLTDREGNLVLENNISVSFDFNEQFFVNMKDAVDSYNEILPVYDGAHYYDSYQNVKEYCSLHHNGKEYTTDELNEIASPVETKLKDLQAKIDNKEAGYETYTYLSRSYIYGSTSSAIGRVVLYVGLYLIAVVIIYFLFFHFRDIKNFVFRDRSKQTEIRPKQQNNVTKAKVVNEKGEEIKETTQVRPENKYKKKQEERKAYLESKKQENTEEFSDSSKENTSEN